MIPYFQKPPHSSIPIFKDTFEKDEKRDQKISKVNVWND